MLKAVLFDLDNTLIDRDGAFRACLPEGSHDELMALDRGGYSDREEVFAAWRRYGPMDQQTLTSLYSVHVRPDPGLLEALRELARVVALAVVSNGGSETQRCKLQASGLYDLIGDERILVSGELDIEKPDPRIFLLASQRLGVSPSECLVVGDQDHLDGAGARAAGMAFCLVRSPLTGASLREHVAEWLR